MPKMTNISKIGIKEPKFELFQVNSENWKGLHWTCSILTLLLSSNTISGCFSNVPRIRSYGHYCDFVSPV